MPRPAKKSTASPPSVLFSPAIDQSVVSHLKLTVKTVTPFPKGVGLRVTCGDVSFPVAVPELPGRPEYKPGDRLLIEFPRWETPLLADYSAIYHDPVFSFPPLVATK